MLTMCKMGQTPTARCKHYQDMKRILLLLLLMPVLASCQSDPYVIKTTNGLVRGFDEEGTMAFKGIPYAKAERCMPSLDRKSVV